MADVLDGLFGGAAGTSTSNTVLTETSLKLFTSTAMATTTAVAATSTAATSSVAATPNSATPVTSTVKSTTSIISSVVASSSAASSSAVTSTTSKATSTSTALSTSSVAKTTSTSSTHLTSASSTLSTSTSTTKSTTSTSSATAAAASSTSSKGVFGSGLSLGAFIGIIAGGVVALVLLAVIITRSVRKRQRAKRTAQRSSMFDWPATNREDESYEKPRYEPPSQTYAMADSYNSSNSVPYHTNERAYAPVPQQSYMNQSRQPSYPPQQHQQYTPQQSHYPVYQENVVPPPEDVTAASAVGLKDGSLVRVKVGFVRSLDDELAIVPGQQLYLHTAYDDGWSLCEDQNRARGVVPLSCLEPWQDSLAPIPRSRDGSTQNMSARSERRSSLYRDPNQGR